MTIREDEAIALHPARIRGVESEVAIPELEGGPREAHRRPGVAGTRLFDRVHGEEANGIFDALTKREVEIRRHRFSDG